MKGRPCGSVTQLAECSHGKREALGSSPGRATIFFFPVTRTNHGITITKTITILEDFAMYKKT